MIRRLRRRKTKSIIMIHSESFTVLDPIPKQQNCPKVLMENNEGVRECLLRWEE